MNNYKQVQNLLAGWKAQGLSKAEIICRTAGACLGWPYVWGGYGQLCSPGNRRSYADRASCPSAEAEQIRKKCPALSGKDASCAGCKYAPSGTRTRFFDCRGFTRWLLQQAGLSLRGSGATSQWNDASNWAEKGVLSGMPMDKVCCVFMAGGKKMSHTGMHVGNGVVIHCSGEVKKGKTTDRGWSHYAVPAGLAQQAPIPVPDPQLASQGEARPLLRRGSGGDAVKELQENLMARGYDLGKWGADGIFGKQTLKAVKAFQQDCGIKVDGICGPMTWGKLLE